MRSSSTANWTETLRRITSTISSPKAAKRSRFRATIRAERRRRWKRPIKTECRYLRSTAQVGRRKSSNVLSVPTTSKADGSAAKKRCALRTRAIKSALSISTNRSRASIGERAGKKSSKLRIKNLKSLKSEITPAMRRKRNS